MNLLAELAAQVDPVTLGVLVAFWARWETWRTTHEHHHRTIDLHLTMRSDP